MSRTIHAFFPAPTGDFWKHLLCICPDEGDDPNCPALRVYQQQQQANENTKKLEPQANALRDELAALPRSAVEIAMSKPYDGDEPEITIPLAHGVISVDLARPGGDRTVQTLTRINEAGDAVPDLRSPAAVAVGSNPFVQKREALQREMVSSKYALRRRGRMIPERGRMVVARVEWDEKIGSIFMLDGHKKQLEQSNQEAVIMACGPLRIDPATGKEVPMRFSIQEAIGKHIVIREHSGIEFVTHDENGKEIICYWIGQSEIWGWLEPYPGDEANSPEIWQAIAYLGEETAKSADPEGCIYFCAIRGCKGRCVNTVFAHERHLCSGHAGMKA